jgi:hypothetical protein
MRGGGLPIILLAAVLQGWGLYALHLAIEHSAWPATEPGLLMALYAIAIVAPLTVQMLAQHVRQPLTWMFVASLAAFYLLVGWHYGAWVIEESRQLPEGGFGAAFVAAVQWLLLMPFLQGRLIEGRWRVRYEVLFASAWNNKLVLAEGIAFTGLFWLLLFLWAKLFEMLGISFFAELFREPMFIYPVTTIVFGTALKLIGSLELLTNVVLEQTLSVLKWLALLAGLILALFTVALVFKLPGMIASGQKAIAAAWLLWLIAGTVLLVNAAYRDGSVANPYPRSIDFALRCVIPLTVIIGLVAVYALWLRVDQYGFTVSRFWAWVVAGAAVLYSAGYAASAVRDKQHWMHGIARVNVLVALYLIAVLSLALTPVLSPYRIAANSQYAMVLAESTDSGNATLYDGRRSPLSYLRFDAGKYGRKHLEELSRIENHPRASGIRREATAELARQRRYGGPQYDSAAFVADLVVQPSGRTLDPALTELAATDASAGGAFSGDAGTGAGIFVDLNMDRTEEFVLLIPGRAMVYGIEGGSWRRIGTMTPGIRTEADQTISRVRDGDFTVEASAWNDLVVGGVRYRTTVFPR